MRTAFAPLSGLASRLLANWPRVVRPMGHPPINPAKRAFCSLTKGDLVWPQYEYLVRNQHIVNQADVLIATPGEFKEQRRSGTWSTVRKARAKGITVHIVTPDGHYTDN